MKLTEEAERRRGRGTATQLAIQPSADLRAWRRRRCRPPPSCAPVTVPRVPRFVCIRQRGAGAGGSWPYTAPYYKANDSRYPGTSCGAAVRVTLTVRRVRLLFLRDLVDNMICRAARACCVLPRARARNLVLSDDIQHPGVPYQYRNPRAGRLETRLSTRRRETNAPHKRSITHRT